MARIGKYELWQICIALALAALLIASILLGVRASSMVIGVFFGISGAWFVVALAGFLSERARAVGIGEPLPTIESAGRDSRSQPKPLRDLNRLVESIGDPVIVVSPEGKVILANSRASKTLGLSKPLVDRFVDEVVTKAELLDRISRGRRGERWRGSVRLPNPDGVQVCDVSIVPLTDEVPAAVVVTLRDITALDGALQLKTDFVANASHELRTPIAAIKGAAETLSIAGGDESMRSRFIGMIEAHVIRLEDMVSDLLDLSKLESESMAIEAKPLNMTELAGELSQLLYDLCTKRGVEIVFDIDDEAQTVTSDKRLLVLILKNLCENAAKFTAEGTSVSVSVKPIEDNWEFRVSDRGQGIPLQQQQRIFERFYQVDPSRSGGQRGTGLGLAIVKHAVRLLQGDVDVESVWNQGTTMVVTLPRQIDPSAAAESV
ncbi:MAG: hypothetical protein Phyf2KO_16380 [Phycisphaerales bacterium]